MKRLLILTVGVCLLLTSVPAMADQAADEAAVRKVMEQIYTTANNHDVDAFVAHFAEDYENQDGTVKGREAWRKRIAGIWVRQKGVQYSLLEEISLTLVTSELALFKNRDEVTGVLDVVDGKPVPPQKRLVAYVLVKRSDEWLVMAAFSSPIEE